MHACGCSTRNKDQKLIGRLLKIEYFTGYYTAVPLKMSGKLIDFGRPNAEIDRKMANGQLLFVALVVVCVSVACVLNVVCVIVFVRTRVCMHVGACICV